MKKLFATVLAILIAVFAGSAVFVACNNDATIKYEVTVNCGRNGSYTLDSSDGKYAEGSIAKLTITPNAGYEIDAVKIGGKDITQAVLDGNNVYEFTVDHAEEFTITFKAIIVTYSVKVNCGKNGSYALSGKTAVYNDGAEVKLTIVPDDRYKIASVKDGSTDITDKVLTSGGKDKGDEGKRTYKFNIDSDKEFTVAFIEDNELSVTIKDYNSELGSIEVSPQKEAYDLNEEVTITATLKSDQATAGRFWVYGENWASELNKSRTLVKTVKITKRLTVDAYFDDWHVKTEISAKTPGFMDEFLDMINQELVLVDFNATACGPCKEIEPAIDNFAKLGLAKVISFNVAPRGDLVPVDEVEPYMISGFPTVVGFSYGEELKLYACTNCNKKAQDIKADACGRVDESSLAENSWVIATERPDACPKCGEDAMDVPELATCISCGGLYVVGYSSDISPVCPYCKSRSVWAPSINRITGKGSYLTTDNEKTQCRYLCEVLGLDPALVK